MTYPKYIRVDQDNWWGFVYRNGTFLSESTLLYLMRRHNRGRDDGTSDWLDKLPIYTFPTAMFVVMED